MSNSKSFAIIGAGPAGYQTALELRKLDKESKIYLFEKDKAGGACLHYGCIPSKQLQSIESESEYLKLLKKNKTLLEKGLLTKFKEQNINFINEEANYSYDKQLEKFTVKSDSENINCDYLILALGSKPRNLNMETKKEVIDSDIFFSEEYLSKGFHDSYCFIGGGYIAVELASMLANLGKKVRILEKETKILNFLDDKARDLIESNLKKQGIKIETGLETINFNKIEEEIIFEAIGREAAKANLDQEALEVLGKKLFLLGDMKTELPLAHLAYAQARELAAKIYNKSFQHYNLDLVPQVIFTTPEFAHVGPSLEKLATEQKDKYEIIEKSWASNAKARIMKNDRGYYRLILEKETRTILACTLIGKRATDLISIIIPPINLGLSLDQLLQMIFPHPTLGEIFIETT
ncbi:MAG: NAD(P)/FAD-dependent oxidoreductase [Candidatus Caenarcaniphilales bacterium]|nr:NAD(P)/FAD-dependent oxidoreductase [Candidatus Caenarcaniphilales bacterium]